MSRVRCDVWYDERPSVDVNARLDALKAIGVGGVRLMVNSEAIRDSAGIARRPRTFADSLKWREEQVVDFLYAARERGMATTLTLWPQSRDPRFNEELAAFLRRVQRRIVFGRVEFDVEGFGWYKGLSSRELLRAGEALRKALEREGVDAPMSATTYPGAVGVCVRSLPLVETWTLQAYSQYRPERSGYGWEERYGPGKMQFHAAAKLNEASLEAELEMGLAAYRQKFSGRSEAAAMQAALDAATTYSDVVCYWSSGWLRPNHAATSALMALLERSKASSAAVGSRRPA